LLQYASHGTSSFSQRSKTAVARIKQDRPPLIDRAVERLQERFDLSGLATVLGGSVILVPAPGSAPMRSASDLWVPRRIAEGIVSAGLALAVAPCLRRVHPVPKAAFSRADERPTVEQHFESMVVEPSLEAPEVITVVDDVVTSGAMLLASASRLHRAFPRAEIRGFSLVRTISSGDIDHMLDPCVGRIRYLGRGRVVRDP
jgi:hypothetical protein